MNPFSKFSQLATVGLVWTMLTANSFAQEVVLDTDSKKLSYAVGTRIGQQLLDQFENDAELEIGAVLRGLNLSLIHI